ncbi:MAG: hypothetical protein Q7J45_00605 [bacterium]|nr:hypothetical protein [bacterium]
MTLAAKILTLAESIGHQLAAIKQRLMPLGGVTGQTPIKTADGLGWADPPPGTNIKGLPLGGVTGDMLYKASVDDGDAFWGPPPAGGGGGGGSAPTTVTRGFRSNVVTDPPDPLNATGMQYIIRKEGPVSVVDYDAVKGDALSGPASSIPNLTMLKCPGTGWKGISLMLGTLLYGVMPKFLKKLQAGSWRGVARFTLENEDPNVFGNFFVGALAGSEAVAGAIRGWEYINGSQFGASAIAGVGFEYTDENVQFVWSFNDEEGTQRIPTTVHRSALLSTIHEARFVLTEDKTALSATLVQIPSGLVVAGPELLPLKGGNLGYTMSIGRGAHAFDADDNANKYVGVAFLTMETDY